jgi:LPS sulfotransferase NodH
VQSQRERKWLKEAGQTGVKLESPHPKNGSKGTSDGEAEREEKRKGRTRNGVQGRKINRKREFVVIMKLTLMKKRKGYSQGRRDPLTVLKPVHSHSPKPDSLSIMIHH